MTKIEEKYAQRDARERMRKTRAKAYRRAKRKGGE